MTPYKSQNAKNNELEYHWGRIERRLPGRLGRKLRPGNDIDDIRQNAVFVIKNITKYKSASEIEFIVELCGDIINICNVPVLEIIQGERQWFRPSMPIAKLVAV